jgi:hypothetical protein
MSMYVVMGWDYMVWKHEAVMVKVHSTVLCYFHPSKYCIQFCKKKLHQNYETIIRQGDSTGFVPMNNISKERKRLTELYNPKLTSHYQHIQALLIFRVKTILYLKWDQNGANLKQL